MRRSLALAAARKRLFLHPSTGQVYDGGEANQGKNKNTKKGKNQPIITPLFQAIIGLEIHAQLDIPTKLFSPASVVQRRGTAVPNAALRKEESDATSNDDSSHHPPLHPYDVAVPGFLPVLSKEAVHAAVLAAAILRCDISTTSRFERKHYTYPDLPLHYQITQQRWPLAVNGELQAAVILNPQKQSEQRLVSCRVHRIQLEQDTGKTIQQSRTMPMVKRGDDNRKESVLTSPLTYTLSCVDFNRAGQALIEIVLEPDLRTPLEAAAVTESVRQLLKHVGVCDGRMEEGSLRVDVNVNIEQVSANDEGSNIKKMRKRSPRCEVKNLNSIRQVRDAVEFEVLRQAREWDDDDDMDKNKKLMSTRTWNPSTRATELIRKKDVEQDYRFMPEPDLPPLVLNEHVLDGMTLEQFLKARMPELPHEAVDRLQRDYGLTPYQAKVIAGDPPAVAFLDKAIAAAKAELNTQQQSQLTRKDVSRVHTLTTNLLINDLFALVHESPDDSEDDFTGSVQDSRVSPQQLGQVAVLQFQRKLSNTMAVKLLKILFHEDDENGSIVSGSNPAEVAAERGMQLICDPEQLRSICNERIDACDEEREKYIVRKDGKFKSKMVRFFSGQVMAATKGNADPELLQQVLGEELEKRFKEYHNAEDT